MRDNNRTTFFERKSWYHRTKILNEDGTIKYGKKGGFQTQEEAEKSYKKWKSEFEKEIKEHEKSKSVNPNITLKTYLNDWFNNIFCKRIESTTQLVAKHILYSYIIPYIDVDLKVRYVNTEYFDDLLKKISPISKSSGNKTRELLMIAMSDAVADGYINYNPIKSTKTYPRKKQILLS